MDAAPTPWQSAVVLPVFEADAPLMLYYHCWAGCGQAGGETGIFVMNLDGSRMKRPP